MLADVEFGAGLDTVRDELESPVHFFALDGAMKGWASFGDAVSAQSDTSPARRGAPDDLVYRMYTSGTTGLPKGAMVSQRAVVAHLQQLSTLGGVVDNPWTLIVMPMYHAGGAVPGVNTIAQGGSIHVMADFLPGEVARVLAVEALRAAAAAFGCKFIQIYGMTETTAAMTALFPEDHERALAGEDHLLLSAGGAILATELRIVDPDDTDVPADEVGEILGRGSQLMEGYHNRPEAGAEALADGWMHTGDAGSLDDEGFLSCRIV